MFTWKRIVLAISGVVILALLLIVTVLPEVIRSKAAGWVAQETGRNLSIESISINPFSLSLEIQGLALSNRNLSGTFIAWDRLRVSLSLASVFRRAPIIDELTLEAPEINVQRVTEDTFNFSDLIPAKEEASDQEEGDKPVRFSVNNIAISSGTVTLVDDSLDEPTRHTVEEFTLILPSIGNLPYMVDNPAQPLLSAIINDSQFKVEGHLKPFTDIQEMIFDIKLDNIDLPHYLGYVPVELPVELRNGKLNLDLDVSYRVSQQVGSELQLSGKVDLVSLDIWDRLQEKLFFLPLLQVDIASAQPLKQDVHVSSLRVYNLEVQLARDQYGNWNHARMAGPESDKSTDPEEGQDDTAPFKLAIDTIELHDGVIFFVDRLPEGGFKTTAREINIDIRDFALDATSRMPLSLTLETDRRENVAVNGDFLLQPFTLSLHNELHNISLGAYEPYYREFYNKPLGGVLNLESDLMVSPDQPLLINNGKITLHNLQAAFNEKEGFKSGLFELDDLSFDLGRNRLELGSARSTDTEVNFSRNDAGEWSFMSRNFPILAKLSTASGSQEQHDRSEPGPDFSFLIQQFSLANWNIDFRDNLPENQAHIQINNLAFGIQNLSLPEAQKSPLDFSAQVTPGGKIAITGQAVLAEQKVALNTNLRNIPLKKIAPYIAEHTNLVLTDGRLNADLATRANASKDLDLSFGGKIGINRLHLLDGTHREDLLKWDSLQISGVKGKLEPLSLGIESVTLSDYFAKVLIDEEAKLNLVEAFKKEATEDSPAETNGEEVIAVESEVTDGTKTQTDIRINKVVLQGGQVDFTDRNLPSPFHADMTELGGRIDGLSSHPGTQATVDLRGSLRNQSPLNITGQLNPLAEDIFLDVDLNFSDIEMTPFSPYSGNYVGYMIEKGKLNLSLDYLVEDNQLKATNKVFLDQFDFGSPVESENAVSLPVKLAVALLKDGNGEIHLDIPVYGNLEDPQFSIAGVVWTVIKNLLVKAATSPFALLGALIGGGEEDFSAVHFDYGSAQLNSSNQDKLLRMAKALLERPSLDVEVSGFIDPENDPEGFRRELLASKIKRLKYLDLVDEGELPEGTSEEEVVVPESEYSDYLWQVYKDEPFPKPRNFIGMTKKLPADEMEKLIYTNTDVTDDDLSELAQARALVVQNFLIENGEMPKERIFLTKPDITEAPDEDNVNRARAELGASVK